MTRGVFINNGRLLVPSFVYGRQVATVASQTLTTTADTDITGAVVTLPSAGTYRVFYTCRLSVATSGTYGMIRLYNVTDAAAIADSEVQVLRSGVTALVDASGTGEIDITVTASKNIQLQARTNVANDCVMLHDLNGKTWIGYQRI